MPSRSKTNAAESGAAETNAEAQPSPPMVRPGERAVLLSHYEYQLARKLGAGLENYDLLMRQPDDVESPFGGEPESERWQPVRADKYLKHRATGWREVAEGREVFPASSVGAKGAN